MDNDQTALNPNDEEQVISESPTEEQDLPEEEVVEAETESTEEEKAAIEPEAESKKNANARIRELNEEKKKAEEEARQAREEAKSLAEQMRRLTGRDAGNMPSYPPQMPIGEPEPLIKPGEEQVTPEELERRQKARDEYNMRRTQALIELNMAREKNLERINNEVTEVVNKYPQLNPQSEAFDNDLNNSIVAAVEAYVKQNPTASVKEYVDTLIKPYQRSIEKKVGEEKEAITKRASETALRPTQVPAGNEQEFSKDLSLEEMEKRLGKVYR